MLLSDVQALVRQVSDRTRPVGDAELVAAINFGYRELIRAIRDLQAEQFVQETNGFVMTAGKTRYPLDDLTLFPKPVRRVRRIVGISATGAVATPGFGFGQGGFGQGGFGGGGTAGGTGQETVNLIQFRWVGIEDAAFMQAEVLAPTDAVVYDLIFPGGVPTLAIAPKLTTDQMVQIITVYEPTRLSAPTEAIEPVVADHIEAVVARALEIIFRATNDSDADRWGLDAKEMRSQIIQDVSTRAEQNTTGFGTDLGGMYSD